MTDLSAQAFRGQYHALEPLGAQTSRFRFSGPFQGRTILWDTRLMTLRRYYGTLTRRERREGVRQFIDVGTVSSDTGLVTVALNVPRIDGPAVLKTLTMLRQWKRLAEGRHEYGEAHHFGADSTR